MNVFAATTIASRASGIRGMERTMGRTDAAIINLALGRIFRMASRPTQPGDMAEYERCRGLILDRIEAPEAYAHDYIRDRNRGAAGDHA